MSFLDTFESEFTAIEALTQDIRTTTDACSILYARGSSPSSIAILQKTGLLASTALEDLALESLVVDDRDGPQTKLALESLSEKIKEKATAWSAKILHITQTGSQQVLKILEPLWTKISAMMKTLASKTWDATKATGRVIKAHPVKTVLAVVASVAAVAGIITYCGSNLPGAETTKAQLDMFVSKVRGLFTKIPWPFGKGIDVTSKGAERFRVDVVFPPKASGETIEKLGWTQKTMQVLSTHLDKVWSSIKSGLMALPKKAVAFVSAMSHSVFRKIDMIKADAPERVYRLTGSWEAARLAPGLITAAVYATLISVFWALYRLIKKIVVGGFHLIGSMLYSLGSLV